MRRRGMSEMSDLTVHDKHDAVTVSLGVVVLAVDAEDDEAVRTAENGAGTSSLSHLPPPIVHFRCRVRDRSYSSSAYSRRSNSSPSLDIGDSDGTCGVGDTSISLCPFPGRKR